MQIPILCHAIAYIPDEPRGGGRPRGGRRDPGRRRHGRRLHCRRRHGRRLHCPVRRQCQPRLSLPWTRCVCCRRLPERTSFLRRGGRAQHALAGHRLHQPGRLPVPGHAQRCAGEQPESAPDHLRPAPVGLVAPVAWGASLSSVALAAWPDAPLEPAGTALEPAGAPLDPAGTALEPAGTALEPAGTAPSRVATAGQPMAAGVARSTTVPGPTRVVGIVSAIAATCRDLRTATARRTPKTNAEAPCSGAVAATDNPLASPVSADTCPVSSAMLVVTWSMLAVIASVLVSCSLVRSTASWACRMSRSARSRYSVTMPVTADIRRESFISTMMPAQTSTAKNTAAISAAS